MLPLLCIDDIDDDDDDEKEEEDEEVGGRGLVSEDVAMMQTMRSILVIMVVPTKMKTNFATVVVHVVLLASGFVLGRLVVLFCRWL